MNRITTKQCIQSLRRFGLFGFVFFFAKGMVWIIAPIVLARLL